MKPTYEELMEDNTRGALYVQHLNARIEELEAHLLRLIETGGILADVSTEYRRKLWTEAVREVVK